MILFMMIGHVLQVEGDEDGDNSDPGSEAGPDEDETAEENSTDTDSGG